MYKIILLFVTKNFRDSILYSTEYILNRNNFYFPYVFVVFDETQYSAGNRSVCELTDSPHAGDVRLTLLSDDGMQGVPEVCNQLFRIH